MSGKVKNSEIYIVIDVGGIKVYLAALRPKDGVTADDIAKLSKRVESKCPGTILAGLPHERIDPCAGAVTYLHALEHSLSSRRVKSLSLRFLMEYMGLRQIRDAVNAARSGIEVIVVASLNPDCLKHAIRLVLHEDIGSAHPLPTFCSPEIVSSIVEKSVVSGTRFD